MPLKSAPEVTTSSEYLAFYQPKVFEEEKWTVNYYAKVLGHSIKKRIELYPTETEHNNRDEDYYQIFIGELIRLENPIPSHRL